MRILRSKKYCSIRSELRSNRDIKDGKNSDLQNIKIASEVRSIRASIRDLLQRKDI